MNNQILTVNTQKIVFSLLAIATVGLTPLSAKADEALIQENFQDSFTSGVGNVSVQNSRQLNQQRNDYSGRHGAYRNNNNNIGIVQRSRQLCDQAGQDNVCVQNADQINRSHTRRRARRSRW